MIPVLLLLSVAATAETDPTTDRSQRVLRVEEILRLGASTKAADLELLLRVLTGAVTPWERAAAIKALRPHHASVAVAPLQKLIDDPNLNVQLEATVVLHRYRPTPLTLLRLERWRDRGARLRGAFQTGDDHGRPVYAEGALTFFRKSVLHPMLETRLDGALGLIETGGAARDEGMRALEEALSSTDPGVRRTVIRVLNVQYDEPKLTPLLERAKLDPDEEVRTLASNILASRR